MTKNQVMLYKLLVNFPNDHQYNLAEAMTIQRNLMMYGYMLDENAFNQLKVTSLANAVAFYEESAEMLKDMLGGKHSYESLYKNFPNDVLSMNDSELYWNKILHYYGKKNFGVVGEVKDEMFEQPNYKIIKGSDENGFLEVYKLLAGSGVALAKLDIKVLKYFTTYTGLLPEVTVPFKENLATLASVVEGFTVKTVVDVLRIALAMSGGDPSLPPIPKKLKLKGAKWKEREAERAAHKFKLNDNQKLRVLSLLENTNLSLSDLNQGSRKGRFIRLAEVIRTQDYVKEFPKTFAAFDRLRNQKRKGKPNGQPKIRSWNSQVETQFKIGFIEGLTKLVERPGEFIRKLDLLVRKNINDKANLDAVLLQLSTVGEQTSNKVLFEVFTHFSQRDKEVQRSIFVKGARQKTQLPTLQKLPNDVIESIKATILSSIQNKMTLLPKLGKVYIDPELKKIPLPTNMSTLSESLTPIIRGQAMPIDTDKKVLRFYIHWFDERGTEDLDLHGYIYTDGFKASSTMGFNGIHKSTFGCYSGDVRCRKGACAEYIDINIAEMVSAGYRYFTPMVNNFQRRPMKTMKDCVMGFMYRDKPQANSTWLPDTVEVSMKPAGDAVSIVCGTFDFVEMTYTHMDIDWDGGSGGNKESMSKLIKDLTSEPEISVYDLLSWHVQARGSVSDIELAETQLTFDQFCKDYTAVLPWMGA